MVSKSYMLYMSLSGVLVASIICICVSFQYNNSVSEVSPHPNISVVLSYTSPFSYFELDSSGKVVSAKHYCKEVFFRIDNDLCQWRTNLESQQFRTRRLALAECENLHKQISRFVNYLGTHDSPGSILDFGSVTIHMKYGVSEHDVSINANYEKILHKDSNVCQEVPVEFGNFFEALRERLPDASGLKTLCDGK